MRKTVAIDLDGTLAQYDGWEGVDVIGEPIKGAREFVEEIAQFADVMIYTTRCCEAINKMDSNLLKKKVESWLDKYGFTYHAVWTGQGKPDVAAFVDDNGVACRPQESELWYISALEEVEWLCKKDKVNIK